MCGADIELDNMDLECNADFSEPSTDQTSLKGSDDISADSISLLEGTLAGAGSKNEEFTRLKLTSTPPKNGLGGVIRREENLQSPQQTKSLQQEFTLVNFDNVTLDEVRLCRLYEQTKITFISLTDTDFINTGNRYHYIIGHLMVRRYFTFFRITVF